MAASMTINNSQNNIPSSLLGQRRAGVILHPTSLPGPFNQGDLGPDAYQFVNFMADSGLSIWQILPIGPVHEDRSPYMSLSMYAGNPELISLELLHKWGWLSSADLKTAASATSKKPWLQSAAKKYFSDARDAQLDEYNQFLETNSNWINDYALFESLRARFPVGSWSQWPEEYKHRDEQALKKFSHQYKESIQQVNFEQFVFYRQWSHLKEYANERDIIILGDMPIFVAHDSADVWQRQEYFDLKPDGSPRVIAGVPPDYFSETGQRWGNPLYRWDRMAKDNYQWWVDRFRLAFTQYDSVRVDHFRGFEAYWEIDAKEETAINGHWVKAPGEELFKTLSKYFDELPIVVEDLGTITPEVDALREQFGWPGMKILQFAFDGSDSNPYLPHNHIQNCVVYTGTHDNDTTLSWYEDLPQETRDTIAYYLGNSSEPMPWSMVEATFRSVANWAIVPMQDLMSLGKGHRMNVPGVTQGNWTWRFQWDQVVDNLVSKIKNMVVQFERDV